MATARPIDKEITDKRPLRLACVGGPLKYMQVYETAPEKRVPISEETGGGILGTYFLKDAVYVWDRG